MAKNAVEVNVTEEKFEEAFRAKVLEVTGQEPPVDLGMDVPLTDLEMDSLSQTEVISHLEAELDVRIRNDQLGRIRTPRDLYLVLNNDG